MAFGTPPRQFAIDSMGYLRLKEQTEARKEQEKIQKQKIFQQMVKDRPTIKVGMARDEYKQEKKEKKNYAQQLQLEREKTKRELEKEKEKRKFEEEKAKREHEHKLELEFVKASLKPEKEPSMSDYKLQDAINDIRDGNLGNTIEDAQGALQYERKIPLSHPEIQKALNEKYVLPQQRFDKAFFEAKDIQRGTSGQTYKLGKIGETKEQPANNKMTYIAIKNGKRYLVDVVSGTAREILE